MNNCPICDSKYGYSLDDSFRCEECESIIRLEENKEILFLHVNFLGLQHHYEIYWRTENDNLSLRIWYSSKGVNIYELPVSKKIRKILSKDNIINFRKNKNDLIQHIKTLITLS